jgi:SAM-dependent methyltransferase
MMVKVPCNICGCAESRLLFKAKDLNYRVSDEEYNVVKCSSCGLVYLNPRPRNPQQFYPSDYGPHQIAPPKGSFRDSTRRALQLFYNYPAELCPSFIGRLERIFKQLELKVREKYFLLTVPYSPSKRILDLGCGNGKYLMSLQSLGWKADTQLYGLDYPNESLRRLRESHGLNIMEGDFLSTDLPIDFFDVVTMKHVLEHFPDPYAVMAKVASILKPGGTVLIEIPNFKSIEALFLLRDKWHHIDAPRHLYHFSPRTLRLLLNRAGFDVEMIRLKKSIRPFSASLAHFGYNVPRLIEKYLICNMLELCRLIGFSGELQCKATKR